MLFKEITGKTIDSIEGLEVGSQEVTLQLDGCKYKMFHYQDCCEHVRVAEIVGGCAEDLVGKRILAAEESTSHGVSGDGTGTWTFYTIRTMDTSVTIRWLGESNGYYSEDADFVKVD